MIDDRVDRDSGLTYLPVTNDQLALTTTNRHHGIDRLEPDLHRLVNRLSGNHTRRDLFNGVGLGRFNGTLAINRVAERVHNAALQRRTNRHLENATRTATSLAFGQLLVVAQHDRAHRVALEVQGQAVYAAIELDHLTVLDLCKAMDTDNAVRNRDNSALIGGL